MSKKTTTDEELTKLILSYIKQEGTVNGYGVLHHFTREEGYDENEVASVIDRLYTTNIIMRSPSDYVDRQTRYELSPYGKLVSEKIEEDFIVLDPSSTIEKLKNTVPNIDAIAVMYYEESVKAYKADLLLAATVTLGASAERSILLLIDGFNKFTKDTNIEKKFDDAKSIKTKYDLLKQFYNDKKVGKQLKSLQSSRKTKVNNLDSILIDFETTLDNMFNIYRINRNDAGHPTGKAMEKDVVRANLAMFKRFAQTVYGMIDALEQGNK